LLNFLKLIFSFQEHISSELNPAIQEWMRSHAIRHLNDYINNNNTVQSQNTENYIIRSNAETTNTESYINETNLSNTTLNRMEQNNSNEGSIETENVDFSDALSELEDALTSDSTVNMETSNELPAVVIGTESWHPSVPRDWVILIFIKPYEP
jgi:hypothetical protein